MFEKLLWVVHMEFKMAALISSRIQVHPHIRVWHPDYKVLTLKRLVIIAYLNTYDSLVWDRIAQIKFDFRLWSQTKV